MKKNLKFCENMAFGSTFLFVIFHFIFCGIPAIFAILAAVFGIYFSLPFSQNINSEMMTYLLIISGVLILISFIMYLRKRNVCECVNLKWNKIILITSFVLFSFGVSAHFILPMIMENSSCH